MKKLVFTGSFWDWFWKFFLLSLLSLVTFGLGTIYLIYWQFKYFIEHTAIEK